MITCFLVAYSKCKQFGWSLPMVTGWNGVQPNGSGVRTHEALLMEERRRKNTKRKKKNRALERLHAQQATEFASSSEVDVESLYSILLNRVVSCRTKELAFDLHAIISDKGQVYQRTFFWKVLEQPILQDVLPHYVS